MQTKFNLYPKEQLPENFKFPQSYIDLSCSGTLIPQSSIGGKIPSTRGFYNEKSKTFFQPGVQS